MGKSEADLVVQSIVNLTEIAVALVSSVNELRERIEGLDSDRPPVETPLDEV